MIKPERSFKKLEKSSGKIFSGFVTVVFSGSNSFSAIESSVVADSSALVSNSVVGTEIVVVIIVELAIEVVVEIVEVVVVDVVFAGVVDVDVAVDVVVGIVTTVLLANLTVVNGSTKTVVVAIVVSTSSISNPHSKFSPSTKFCPKEVVVGITTVV